MQNAERRMQNCGVGKADGLVRGSQGLTERKRGAVSTAQDIGGFIPTISNQSGSPRDLSCGGVICGDGLDIISPQSFFCKKMTAPLAARGAFLIRRQSRHLNLSNGQHRFSHSENTIARSTHHLPSGTIVYITRRRAQFIIYRFSIASYHISLI